MNQNQGDEMYIFDEGFGQAATPVTGQLFDDFLLNSPAKAESTGSPTYMNPNDLFVKEPNGVPTETFDPRKHSTVTESPSGSTSSSSRGSSDSPAYRERKMSLNSSNSLPMKGDRDQWSTGFQGLTMPTEEELFTDTDMSGLTTEQDFGDTNSHVDSAFDFINVDNPPSAFNMDASMPPKATSDGISAHNRTLHPKSGVRPQFFFNGSRETSPMNQMFSMQGHSPWSKHSPSSGLEETFNGITMNGDSPNNVNYPANMKMQANGFVLDSESSATPSTWTKDISSPPSTAPSLDGSPVLTVFPTSLKSRVETQIPIRMTLHPLPPGITRLKLPTHTISKPKFLSKPPPERSPDMLELYTSLVCSSAMQDPLKLKRAFARACGDEIGAMSKDSPASTTKSESSKDDEDKPLNGGEVKICSGCIQRERKRASRKKQKKPDEEQLFQRDEERRVIVFNTNEIKEWVDPSKEVQKGNAAGPLEAEDQLPPGVVQVELPMRIACYCRHHNEKLGFQVIFTVKDFTDKVVAQAISNSIMITDDHKTHNPPPPLPAASITLPNGPQLPGAGVFSSSTGETIPTAQNGANNTKFKHSLSTTDLQGLQQKFNPQFPAAPSSNPFAVPSKSGTTSATMTPRNLSRPPSPGALSGPTTKRRKQSSGKVPSMLAMTRLDTQNVSSNPPSMPNGAISPFPSSNTSGFSAADRGFVMPGARAGQFGTSPPTPNGNDNGFVNNVNRSFSLDNLPRHGLISAPSSRQPSRPSSPVSTRNASAPENKPLQSMSHQMFATQGRRPAPLIHKLVPAEGSILGGTEVTLLGNGFYQGLEVMFGDTEATTTTYWGEKCLNCITPPAIQPGTVTVVFKHEHPQFAQMPTHTPARQSLYTYVDDREVELYRLALKTLGKRLQNPTDDPYAAAQQLLGGPGQSMWGMQNSFGSSGGQQRQAGHMTSALGDLTDLESNMIAFLDAFDNQGSSTESWLDLQRPSGHTLLHLASSLGMTRFVSGLVARGADPNMLDNNGNTPMHLAAMFGHSHIVHRLRLAGGNHKIRSIRNFVPADLATSLLAHQASVLPNHHYRSRSVGGDPMRLHSRRSSASSTRSFWETSSAGNAYTDYSSEESDDDEIGDGLIDRSVTSSPQVSKRRPSGPGELARMTSNPLYTLSQQSSVQPNQSQPQLVNSSSSEQQQVVISPAAHMIAWRDQLAAQIQQYQQSVNWTLPHLPALPSLPTMPDYQDHPMVRRVSSLFPQRAHSRPTSASSGFEGWWESLTGSGGSSPSSPSSPPAYDELFPDQINEGDFDIKKASAVQAAGDAALDRHFETLTMRAPSGSSNQASSSTVTRSSTAQTPAGVRNREIKRIRSDKNLFLVWIPLLVIVLGLMLRNAIPDAWQAVQEGRKLLNDFVGKQSTGIQVA